MIKGIIFDFDGVLVDSEQANIEAAIMTFKAMGKSLTEVEIASIPGTSSIDFIPKFMKSRGINDDRSHHIVFEENKENYKKIWPQVAKLFFGEKETIDALIAQGKILAIATTNRLETVEMFFEQFDMRGKFSTVVTREDVSKSKPDPKFI